MQKKADTGIIDKLKLELGRHIKKVEDQEAVIRSLKQDNAGMLEALQIASAYVSYLTVVKAKDGRKVIFIPKKEITRRLGAVSVRARDAGDSYEVEIVESLGTKQ